jgi:hypothetical protein
MRFQLLLQLAELVETPTALEPVPFPQPERPDRQHRCGPAVVDLLGRRKATGAINSCKQDTGEECKCEYQLH